MSLPIDPDRVAATLIGTDVLTVRSVPNGDPVQLDLAAITSAMFAPRIPGGGRLDITRSTNPSLVAGAIIERSDNRP